MKRAIITGATGAIGTALIDALLKQGLEVLVFTRKESKRNNVLPEEPRLSICYAGLSELHEVENISGKEYDVFYHLAWMGASGDGRNDMYLQNENVRYALDAVRLARRFGCKRFVGVGSQAEYGRSNEKLTSLTPVFPEMGYGYAKLCAGLMTRELAHQEGMEHIWIRVLSVYGPHDGENSMVSMLIRELKAGRSPKMTEGTQIWDYLYSYDAAKAFYLAGEKGRDGHVYVLGSGDARPLREYVEEIREQIAPDISVEYGAVPFSPKQVMYLAADTADLRKDTGWEPETSFREGIKKTLVDQI